MIGNPPNNKSGVGEMPANTPFRWVLVTAMAVFILLAATQSHAAGANSFKIGVVDFQKVLNLSEAGKRSRKILLASKQQKENELKSVGDKLKKESGAVNNNILLTEKAKTKKQQELRKRERRLRNDFKAAERELQREQIKASESIFTEVQTVIKVIARENNFDFIIEKSTARAILFSSSKLMDITDTVIKRYNDISR